MERISLSAFFPAYNDQHTIEGIVRTAAEEMRKVTEDFEVLVVDDGSKDETGAILVHGSGTDPQGARRVGVLAVTVQAEVSDEVVPMISGPRGLRPGLLVRVQHAGVPVHQEDLQAAFETYGAVERVNIVTDRATGQPRGFAFVEMANDAEGNNAIAVINGQEVGGRALNVNEARPKPASSGGFGGGGSSRRRSEPRW